MSTQNVKFTQLLDCPDTLVANDIIVVNSLGTGLTEVPPSSLLPAVGAGAAGDIPVFNSSPPALFVDSGININLGQINAPTYLALQENTDGHFLVMNGSGVELVANNNLTLLLNSSGQNVSVLATIGNVNLIAGSTVNLNPTTFLTLQTGTNPCVLSLSVAAAGASYPLVFPSTQGGAGTTLRNDGAGNLTWGL